MSNRIKFLQWNAGSGKEATLAMQQWAGEKGIDIIMVQEPYRKSLS